MKRFDIITEADARQLDIGSTVELTAGGVVTPLARDTLAARTPRTLFAAIADPIPAPSNTIPASASRRATANATAPATSG